MNTVANIVAATLTCSLLTGCQTNKSSPIDEVSVNEGLQRVDNKVVDAVYRRPEARLTEYSKLMLRTPIEVQFAKDWDPSKGGTVLYKMNEPDRETIKTELGDLFAETFRKELEKGGYPLVDKAAPDVVLMQAAIVNLYITAPDVSMDVAGRSKVYTSDAGQMTLIMQLHDSVTGQLLVRAYDHRSGGTDMWQWTNSVTNTAEARRIIATWAQALRKAFDASRAGGVNPAPTPGQTSANVQE
jgi:hypothetical protein